jgi:hypothetical protein
MNEALSLYETEEKVMDISGYLYPIRRKMPETFFLSQPSGWGWGTWKRAWKLYNSNSSELISKFSKHDISAFNWGNITNAYEMLKRSSIEPWHMWDVRWAASVFINRGYSLYPHTSLVRNIGHDDSGMHCGSNELFQKQFITESVSVFPIPIEESKTASDAVKSFFKNQSRTPFLQKGKEKIKLLLQSLTGYIKKKISLLKPILWHNYHSVNPISRKFGMDRGKSIDRYYIESFLQKNSHLIRGNILEVGELTYTKKFGHDVKHAQIITADKNVSFPALIADLTRIETLPESAFDCFICTQTFNFIYDFQKAIQGAHFVLKREGTILATVAGISQISRYDAERWGDYWRFTPMSIQKAFASVFGEENISVEYYGNCLSAIALIKGLASEELKKNELDFKDEDYPVVITVVARKK